MQLVGLEPTSGSQTFAMRTCRVWLCGVPGRSSSSQGRGCKAHNRPTRGEHPSTHDAWLQTLEPHADCCCCCGCMAQVEVKYAVPKDESLQTDDQAAGQQHARGDAAAQGKKIFVGGLAPAVDDKALREHFEEFGAVEDAVVMFDHDRRPRGFGFITFASEESVQAVFARGAMQVIHGKQIEIKPAVPRDMMPPSARGQHTMLYLDPRYGGARHGKGPQHVLNGLHHGLPRHLVPTVDPGQFNSMSALAMQAMAGGFGLQGPEGYGGKQPPGSYDLYGGGVHANGMNGSMNGGNGVFGPSARAALAYLQAQAQLSGMQQAQGGAASKLSGMGALGPSSNGLNLKALALASGLGAAFPPNGSLGAGGDSAAFPDQQQQQQQASVGSEYGAEAAPGVGLGNGDFRYHDASFVPAQTPGWSS